MFTALPCCPRFRLFQPFPPDICEILAETDTKQIQSIYLCSDEPNCNRGLPNRGGYAHDFSLASAAKASLRQGLDQLVEMPTVLEDAEASRSERC